MTTNALGYLQPIPDAVGEVFLLSSGGIQAAIDALPSTGGTVKLQAGTYDCEAAIVINKPNVALVGVDERASVLNSLHTGICIDLGPLAVEFELSDLTLIGLSRDASSTTRAVRIQEGATGHAQDLTIKGFKIAFLNNGASDSTNIENVDYLPITGADPRTCGSFLVSERLGAPSTAVAVAVSNCTIDGCKDDAVVIKHSRPRTLVKDCTFKNGAAATRGCVIGDSVAWCDGVLVEGCSFSGGAAMTNEIELLPSAAQTFTQITLRDCSFAVSPIATHVLANCASIDGRVAVLDSLFGACTGQALTMSSMVRPRVQGCRFSGATLASIGGGTIAGATISNNAITTAGAVACIAFTALTDSAVTSNRCICTSTASGVVYTGNSNRNTVSNNTISITTGTGINTTSTQNVISGNAIDSTTGTCISCTGAGSIISGNRLNRGSAGSAVVSVGGASITCAGNVIEYTGAGVGVNCTQAICSVVGNVINGADTQIAVAGVFCTVSGNTLTGNAGQTNPIVSVTGASCTISGNAVRALALAAICINLAAPRCSVSSNVVECKDVAALNVTAAALRCSFVGNTLQSTGSAVNAAVRDPLALGVSFGNQVDGGWSTLTGLSGAALTANTPADDPAAF